MFQFFKNHNLDSSLVHHKFQHQYLHVPVCASTWGKTIFMSSEFLPDSKLNQSYTTIVFLRDPIDRWLSGLANWVSHRIPQHTTLQLVRDNFALLDVLFDTIRQDEHTEQQLFFLQNVNMDNAKFFLINPTFNQSVNNYFNQNFSTDISKFPIKNQTTLLGGRLTSKKYFQSVLESNPKYMKRVQEFFENDYKFLRNLQFVNSAKAKFRYYDF